MRAPEVGLDIASHAGASLELAYGERMRATQVLKPMLEAKELGKKTGKGVFVWRADKAGKPEKQGVNPRLARGSKHMGADDILDRCVLAMANEAARCLAEQVVDGPRALDLATVFGTGFAPFRGGVLRYADSRGLAKIVERLEKLRAEIMLEKDGANERLGRYEPAPLLAELARKNARFHG